MAENSIQLEDSWKTLLQEEFTKPYMVELRQFLMGEYQKGKIIYPKKGEIFAALNAIAFPKVRVVILGQDPYHGPGQAHGLCFSVPPGVEPPPSLRNIFVELQSDMGSKVPKSGCLVHWAEQGVLLLNAVLTVEKGLAGAHAGKGWEKFTDRIIEKLNERAEPLVFVLWGNYARKKGQIIDSKKHLVLTAPHPSPLSAHNGFFGSRPFSKINEFLNKTGQPQIDWSLTL